MMEAKSPLIKANNIRKEYSLGGSIIHAVAGIDLEIERGELVSIVGKSGSGKSTLMHILSLLANPTSGELYFEGDLVNNFNDTQRARIRSDKIGFVFQTFNLLSRNSAIDNVLLPTLYTKTKATREDAIKILERLDLGDRLENAPNQLSGGQQQRVAIARALINDPPIILADEPTGNLDTKSGDDIEKILLELNEEGRTIVIVTHDMDLANKTDRQIVVSDGKIIEDRKKDA